MGPIDPESFDDDEVRAALAARDIGALYRLLGRLGVSYGGRRTHRPSRRWMRT
ncbi:MAG: hypothetical protein ACRDRI_21595 [Pseudonocardiaceae bacterium]